MLDYIGRTRLVPLQHMVPDESARQESTPATDEGEKTS
jgi:hypothetical protein